MLWFFVALIGYFLLALVFVLDKMVLSDSIDKPIVYTFYSTIFMFGAIAALLFGGGPLVGIDWWWATFSGVAFGFGLWWLFIALRYGETSHISPFVGAIVTIATYGISASFLGEQLSQLQTVGMIVLVLATLLLSFEKSRKHNGFHVGFLWAIMAGIAFAMSHVSAKYIYEVYDFVTGLAWTRASTGLVGLFTLASPSVRALFHKKKKKKKALKPKGFTQRHTVSIIVASKTLAIVGVVAIQYAIAIGSVTLVNAMSGVQFILMFVLIYLLTKLAPRIFKEYFTRRELVVQWVAICLVAVGSALFVL